MVEPKPGATVERGIVNRISITGNGVVKTDGGWRVVGPIDKTAVGQEVEIIKQRRGMFWICLTEEYLPDDYEDQISYENQQSKNRSKQKRSRGRQKASTQRDPDADWRGSNKNKLLSGHQ